MKNNDLLGRPIRTARAVNPDASCLSLEDQTVVRANTPIRRSLLVQIRDLEAWAQEKPKGYGRTHLLGLVELKRKQLSSK